jgi:hypothetical protein
MIDREIIDEDRQYQIDLIHKLSNELQSTDSLTASAHHYMALLNDYYGEYYGEKWHSYQGNVTEAMVAFARVFTKEWGKK